MPRGPIRSHAAFTLVELLVAITLVGVAALLVTTTLVTAHRLDRAARAGSAVDLARRDTVTAMAARDDCRTAPVPEARAVDLPAAPQRPAARVLVRCGR